MDDKEISNQETKTVEVTVTTSIPLDVFKTQKQKEIDDLNMAKQMHLDAAGRLEVQINEAQAALDKVKEVK